MVRKNKREESAHDGEHIIHGKAKNYFQQQQPSANLELASN